MTVAYETALKEAGNMTKKIKVLMVDDETQFRETTRKLLDKKGFKTLMAANGREALDQLDRQPDVVVLDIRMPDMDGNETLEEIQKRVPGLPVIMLTGHGADDSARQSLTQGAFDYLSKPCDIDILAARIADAGKARIAAGGEPAEPKVGDVMIPLGEYTTIKEGQSVGEGIAALKASFSPRARTSRILETGHRSLLVFGARGKIKGILTIVDLLEAILPAYLTAPKPSTADSLQYSPMFWSGMFTREAHQLASTPVSELMSPAPPTIDARANLMEASYRIVNERCRRLLVELDGDLVGVLREQDLFFQFERILP